jgi:hypothetical protein
MKREDLKSLLGDKADDATIDKIMAMNGQDIEKHKSAAEASKVEADGLKGQLAEANKQIEAFKELKPEDLKKAADDYKTKYETALADSKKQLDALKFDHAMDAALTGAKAKNPTAVKALLNKDLLKLNEADGSIVGLTEQLDKVKKDNDYLFTSDTPDPKIVVAGENRSINLDKVASAAFAGAGIKPPGDK